jgi:2-polyprenylphenol 6-hydroxylase
MVWSVSPEKSAALLAMSSADLSTQVSAASGQMLGELTLVTPPVAFPLQQLHVPHIVAPRLALIGDAAHNIHPLAGQGVNLGFRDARALARILCERGAQDNCGSMQLLRRYERARSEDIATMQFTMDALKRLFNNHNPILRHVRNLGLSFSNQIIPLKKMLARHALN